MSIHTIKYSYKLRPQSALDKKSRKVYAYPIAAGRTTGSDIAENLTASTTLTRTDVDAVLAGLREQLIDGLRRGEIIVIEGIGSFQVRLKSEQGADTGGKFRLDNLHVGGVCFRPAAAFLAAVQDVGFQLTAAPLPYSPTDEKISLMLDELFEHNNSITTTDVMRYMNISRRRSLCLLARLTDEGRLVRLGHGTNTLYVRNL